MRRALAGLVALAVVVGLAFAVFAGRGVSAARHRPLAMEGTVAHAVWKFLIPKRVRATANPVPVTSVTLKAAREHWADHCALCHDNDGSGRTTIGPRVYPPTPDLGAPRTQNLTDGELFYAIEQGIPWTAMPGWTTGTSEGEQESWALVAFIRHLPAITPDELHEMEQLNPKPPPNAARQKEIDDFLKAPSKTR